MRSLRFVIFLIAFVSIGRSLPADDRSTSEAFFHERVEPILVGHCLECHGNARKGELDLRTRSTALAGGESGGVIEPGQPDESLLYEYVATQVMPPKKPLTDQQVSILEKWISDGAFFPAEALDPFAITTGRRAGYDWWSLGPLAATVPDEPRDIPAAWRTNPIDRFIFAELAAKGLDPSPPATPDVLIRRATYDLIGLPPTPEELSDFLKACEEETGEANRVGEQAYEQLIDRLLSSPHYGERWGRHWLDVVRFGESNGFERNVIHENVWPFRDYVIRSLNDDKPFDRFVLEQLAGDVLGPHDPAVAVGTAFLVCGPYDNVGNQDAAAAAQIRANTIDEMIRATSEAFLGLTVGCSRCHDHKFDPVAQQDYYRMYASLAGVQHGERALRTKREERQLRELAVVEERIADVEAELRGIQPLAFTGRTIVVDDEMPESDSPAQRGVTRLAAHRGHGTHPKVNIERIEPVKARYVRFTISATNSAEPCIDELEAYSVETDNAPARNVAAAEAGGRASSSGNYPGDPHHRLAHVNDGEYGNSHSWISNENGAGWVQIEFAEVQQIDRIVWGRDREEKYTDRLATSYKIEVATEPGQWQVVASTADRLPRTIGQNGATISPLFAMSAEQAQRARPLLAKLQALGSKADRLNSEVRPPTWWVGNFEQVNGPFHVFVGGSPQRHGAEVKPASINTLARSTGGYELDSNSPESQRRLALAEWIVADDNPLTPRVLANRLWHYHFGTGIVSTPSDFGFMGGRPSHPQLLDWLAIQIKQDGWRLKPVHKRIMHSQTYRQASAFRAEAAKVDGGSRLLWRYPPRRLSGEEIRDAALAVAGKLDTRMGGPGFRLFRYVQDNVATYHPLDVHGPETYRRAVYHHQARAMQIDLMTEFDTPDCAFSAPRRLSTTTPLQALTLMNHSFTVDLAGALAERIERDAGTADREGQVNRAFLLAFSRWPDDEEISAAAELIETHGLRAFCRALLNANEFIYLQ